MGSGITSGECDVQEYVNINNETTSQWLYTVTDTVMITVIIPMIWCLGATTNFAFLFVMLRIPRMRTDTNTYLAHLALADLLYLSLSGFSFIWGHVASPVAFHEPLLNSAGCVALSTVMNVGYYASIALVTMVTFDKYLAVCRPFKRRVIGNRKRTRRLVAICWLVGLIFAGSMVPKYGALHVKCLRWPNSDVFQGLPSVKSFCSAIWPGVKYYTEPLQNVPWLIAMIANIFMYVRITQALNKRKEIAGRTDKVLRTQKQITKMLIVNGVVFFMCQFPYRVISLFTWISLLAQVPDPIQETLRRNGIWISIIPEYINTVVNPLIYGAVNAQFRAAFRQALRCKRRPTGRDSTNPSVSTDQAANCIINRKSAINEEIHESRL